MITRTSDRLAVSGSRKGEVQCGIMQVAGRISLLPLEIVFHCVAKYCLMPTSTRRRTIALIVFLIQISRDPTFDVTKAGNLKAKFTSKYQNLSEGCNTDQQRSAAYVDFQSHLTVRAPLNTGSRCSMPSRETSCPAAFVTG